MNATSLRPLVFDAPSVEDTVVYLVDDEEALLEVIQRFLSSEGYRVRSFSGPSEALSAIEEAPPSLLLTDYRLPDMSGTDLARRALEVDPGIGILLMTGQGDEQAAREALALNALDYLSKPFDLERLAPAVRRATMQLAQQEYSRAASSWLRTGVARQSREIQDVTLGVLSALVKALETRYVHFKGHSHRVAAVAEAVARELDLPRERVSEIQMGALLHDIGMVGVRDYIVGKEGELTEAEYEELKHHPQLGADILSPLGFLEGPSLFVVEHHERLDGSGYPLGLRGNAISLGGADRGYRGGMDWYRGGSFLPRWFVGRRSQEDRFGSDRDTVCAGPRRCALPDRTGRVTQKTPTGYSVSVSVSVHLDG